MSKPIVIPVEMHKIAEFPVKIKYRQPGNVIEYLQVEFEIFKHGDYYKAIPVQTPETKALANVPRELLFQIKNGEICNNNHGTEEIVESIVSKLVEMNVVEIRH